MALVLPLLIVDLLVPAILVLVLAYALVRAIRSLVREPALRTGTNVGVATLGTIAFVLGAWTWYMNVVVVALGGRH